MDRPHQSTAVDRPTGPGAAVAMGGEVLSVSVPDVVIDMTGEGGTRTEGALNFVSAVRSGLESTTGTRPR